VSTEGQILDLRKFGCTKVYRENALGTSREFIQLRIGYCYANMISTQKL